MKMTESTLLFLGLSVGKALAAATPPQLPYSVRTQTYSGYTSTVKGDGRTLGMAGAMTGLADSFIGTRDNPAGLAMTVPGLSAGYSTNQIEDQHLTGGSSKLTSDGLGLVTPIYPWGISIGTWTPYQEGQTFRVSGGELALYQVEIDELQLGLARTLLQHRLGLGVNLRFAQANRVLVSSTSRKIYSYSNKAIAVDLGTMVQLPHRLLIGASLSSGQTFSADLATSRESDSAVGNVYQAVETPLIFQTGLGWIPNRYFQLGTSFKIIGTTQNARLLKDQTLSVGKSTTVQPHFGGSYNWIDLKDLRSTLSTGFYIEPARIENSITRIHWTIGVDFEPWIFTFSWGVDVAHDYNNTLYAGGINLLRLFEKLELVPQPYRPPLAGFLPPVFHLSDDGLPRPLVKKWKAQPPSVDPIDIGKQFPQKLEKKFNQVIEGIEQEIKGSE